MFTFGPGPAVLYRHTSPTGAAGRRGQRFAGNVPRNCVRSSSRRAAGRARLVDGPRKRAAFFTQSEARNVRVLAGSSRSTWSMFTFRAWARRISAVRLPRGTARAMPASVSAETSHTVAHGASPAIQGDQPEFESLIKGSRLRLVCEENQLDHVVTLLPELLSPRPIQCWPRPWS